MNNTVILNSFDRKIKQLIPTANKTITNSYQYTMVEYKFGEYNALITIVKNCNAPVRYMIHEERNIKYCDWGNSTNFFKYLSYITGNGPETQRFMNLNKPYKTRKH